VMESVCDRQGEGLSLITPVCGYACIFKQLY
jgi:hypothetical protein